MLLRHVLNAGGTIRRLLEFNAFMLHSRIRYWLVFLALFAASFLGLLMLAENTLVRIEINHSHSDKFKVYWTTEDYAGWTENNAATVYVNVRKRYHILRLPISLADIQTLRIDPGERNEVATKVYGIKLYNLYTGTVAFGGKQSFSTFKPIQHVADLKTGSALSYTSSGNDPGFIVDFPRSELSHPYLLMLAQAGLLALFLLSLISRLPWLIKDLRWVPAGLLLVTCAITAMATVTRPDSHPDEYVHLNGANYYASHYVPPEVCSKDTHYTYSVYGVSRLDRREIAYYLGGRYLQLVDFVPAPDHLKLRALNIALFFVLVLLAFNHVRARYLFLPLLLTPQAWYLFSYYNSDALSLFAVCLLAYHVFVPGSMLRRLLRGERPPGYVFWILGLALLVAMQYWLKLNYMFYPIMLGMLAASWWLLNRRLPDLSHTQPLWIAIALGTALFLSWEVPRHVINDFSMADRVFDCREVLSHTEYKPSTPLDQTHYNLMLRDKGYTLQDMLVKRDWARVIFFTGLGAYGYTEYLSQDPHYVVASAFILLLLLYVVVTLMLRGAAMTRLSVLSTLAAIFAITAAAAYVNWTADFQPQGRYLMVYLPMLGTLIAMYYRMLSVFWLSALSAVPFLLGLYSYFAIALVEIPK